MSYQPKTGVRCGCKRGVQRDNCPSCEGTGMMIDFAAIRRRTKQVPVNEASPELWNDPNYVVDGISGGVVHLRRPVTDTTAIPTVTPYPLTLT